ncbi:MAG: aldo/keto reductase [Sphingopyxis sp. 65-8]|nr:MAG: aldo/keto reductase [Sphingopyxis sp. 65-8]
MNHLPLGQTGVALPALGLGCMGMSEFYGATDDAQSLEVLRRAVDLGVRMFDTADTYGDGHNERLIGQLLAETSEPLFVATKFGIRRDPGAYDRRIDNSPSYIRTACEASLRRLGRERIDLYYVHRVDAAQPIEETMAVLSALVSEGKIGAVGLSEVSAATLCRAQAVHPVAAVQSEYSLATRDVEAELLPCCRELGVAFVAYSPLGRGLLSGEVTAQTLAPGDFRAANPRFAGEAMAQNLAALDPLRAIAERLGADPSQVALAWVLAQGVFAIPGTKRLRWLEANCVAADLVLSAADLAALDAAYPQGVFAGDRYTAEGMKGVNA